MSGMSRRGVAADLLGQISVGPGTWSSEGTYGHKDDGRGVVVLSRLSGDSRRLLLDVLSALQAPKRVFHFAKHWIDVHERDGDAAAAGQGRGRHSIAWLKIRGFQDGPWRVTALGEWTEPQDDHLAEQRQVAAPSEMEKALKECSRYFGTRRLAWTAMVIGSTQDVTLGRAIAKSLEPNLSRPGSIQTMPSIGVAREGPHSAPKLIVEVSREEVEQGDFCGVALAFDAFTIEQGSLLIDKMAGSVIIAMDGFNDDPREIYEIPSARAFLAELVISYPWVILLCEPEFFHVWAAVLDDHYTLARMGGGRNLVTVTPEGLSVADSLVRDGIHELVFEYLMVEEIPDKIAKAYRDWTSFANHHRRLHGSDEHDHSRDQEQAKTGATGHVTSVHDEDDNQDESFQKSFSASEAGQPAKDDAAGAKSDDGRRNESVRAGDTSRGACDGVTSSPGEEAKGNRSSRREADFWAGFIEMSSPGWMATVNPNIGPTLGLSSLETFIYALDTRTGWVNAAGFTAAQALEVVEQVRGISHDGQDLVTAAIKQITNLGWQGTDQASEDGKLAVISALGALSFTETMKTVLRNQGDLKGSFIYLVYTPTRGDPFGRPLFALPATNGVMPLELLFELVGERMRSDILVPGTSIHSSIQKLGPLIACEALQAIIDQ